MMTQISVWFQTSFLLKFHQLLELKYHWFIFYLKNRWWFHWWMFFSFFMSSNWVNDGKTPRSFFLPFWTGSFVNRMKKYEWTQMGGEGKLNNQVCLWCIIRFLYCSCNLFWNHWKLKDQVFGCAAFSIVFCTSIKWRRLLFIRLLHCTVQW
jgi:hypothetical protein